MIDILAGQIKLVALSRQQLAWLLDEPERLEEELGIPVSRRVITDRVRRAIRRKLTKMDLANTEDHAWYTYWLIQVNGTFGAGLVGFKGVPDQNGEVEIGYGIDPLYQGRGYTTGAVHVLLEWAFQHPACQSVIAPGTLRTNPASNRVLEKVGMHVYQETPDALSWRITRQEFI